MLRKVGAEYDYLTMDNLRRKINSSVHGTLVPKKTDHTYLEPVPCSCIVRSVKATITYQSITLTHYSAQWASSSYRQPR